MKTLVKPVALLLCVLASYGSVFAADDGFTITGEWITLHLDGPHANTYDLKGELDTSQYSAVVVVDLIEDKERSSAEMVLKSSFSSGKVLLQGEINGKTNARISVLRAEEELMTLPVVLAPGLEVSFVVLDYVSPLSRREDEILMRESSLVDQESDSTFKIVGDLSSITDKDLSYAVAKIEFRSSNPKTGSFIPRSNSVLLQNGKFSFEGLASEPLIVLVDFRTRDFKYWGRARAVVEPGAHIKISPSTSSSLFHPARVSDLLADSKNTESFHRALIESWQNSPEYIEKLEQYAEAIELNAIINSPNYVNKAEPGTDPIRVRDPYGVFQELSAIKNSVLSSIAQNLDEPVAALLAMELGAVESQRLEMWNKLASQLEANLVVRRVDPKREEFQEQVNASENAKTIVAGAQVPEFTLHSVDGERVVLYEVLENNELVLVDFGTSWCGPCISSIPKLKELYAVSKDRGFEIVFVSIDDNMTDWQKGSELNDLPWVDVGDLNGFLSATAIDFGVQSVPTAFLINSSGKILDRDLTTDELKRKLRRLLKKTA